MKEILKNAHNATCSFMVKCFLDAFFGVLKFIVIAFLSVPVARKLIEVTSLPNNNLSLLISAVVICLLGTYLLILIFMLIRRKKAK